ncbi:hypothetical protein F5X68DRAFT_265849 [Plectosphaerella plurivora]|uniref:Uncharacterized protein n=1 Tax=Plectosphaerella plurivora TaxID=936078 RepID=A0A9P8UZG5_9PEZI|nr:hypothetical protein F5X68DRAFT_265849 [Plectosphaerella plurivora]
MLLPYLLALAGAAAATEVTLTWAHDKGSGLSALLATKPGSSKSIAVSCSSILEGPSPVDFSQIDENGDGNFTVGAKSYLVHSEPSFSGGPSCVTVYDEIISLDQCKEVEWDIDASASSGADDVVVDCFENEKVKGKLRHLLEVLGDHEPSTGETAPAQVGHITNSTTTALVEPQSGLDERQCSNVFVTVLIGNGNPHQNWHHIQVSQNHHCAQQAGCNVGYSTTTSVGWSASSSISMWINKCRTGSRGRLERSHGDGYNGCDFGHDNPSREWHGDILPPG